jgi:hypothetical protein
MMSSCSALPYWERFWAQCSGRFQTYFVTRLNHANDNTKEAGTKRGELVLHTANDIAEFEHLISTYASAISNHVQGLEGAIDMEATRNAVIHRNRPLRRARMTLKLLGLTEAEEQLEKYIELTSKVVSKGLNLKCPASPSWRKIIVKGPVEFYAALKKEFPTRRGSKWLLTRR